MVLEVVEIIMRIGKMMNKNKIINIIIWGTILILMIWGAINGGVIR